MKYQNFKSEIRDSIINKLLDKVRKQNYSQYLIAIRLESIRKFCGAQITFDFPVTALIGPNGSGKSTILNVAACAYNDTNSNSISPEKYFPKSRIGDESMNNWAVEYEMIEKSRNPKGTMRSRWNFFDYGWGRWAEESFDRSVKVFSINRTVPAIENSQFLLRRKLRISKDEVPISKEQINNIDHI